MVDGGDPQRLRRPYETFATPPRHLHRNDQEEQITHWASGTVPWDAPDPA